MGIYKEGVDGNVWVVVDHGTRGRIMTVMIKSDGS